MRSVAMARLAGVSAGRSGGKAGGATASAAPPGVSKRNSGPDLGLGPGRGAPSSQSSCCDLTSEAAAVAGLSLISCKVGTVSVWPRRKPLMLPSWNACGLARNRASIICCTDTEAGRVREAMDHKVSVAVVGP